MRRWLILTLFPLLGLAPSAGAADLESLLDSASLRCPGAARIPLNPSLPDPISRSISIRVVDAQSGLPLGGKEVHLVAGPGARITPEGLAEPGSDLWLRSDEGGQLRFRVAPEEADRGWTGPYEIRVQASVGGLSDERCEIFTRWEQGDAPELVAQE